jgi:hypothetical protein
MVVQAKKFASRRERKLTEQRELGFPELASPAGLAWTRKPPARAMRTGAKGASAAKAADGKDQNV